MGEGKSGDWGREDEICLVCWSEISLPSFVIWWGNLIFEFFFWSMIFEILEVCCVGEALCVCVSYEGSFVSLWVFLG